MRILFGLMGMLIAGQAWACPNLHGAYSCKRDDGSELNMWVAQASTPSGVMTYVFENVEFLADGDWHITEHESDELLSVTSRRAVCGYQQDVVAEELSKFSYQGEHLFALYNRSQFFAKANRGMSVQVRGYLDEKGEKSPIHYNLICSRL